MQDFSNQDMALLGESVSGISRSGRVRKKSAKLMEMEDLDAPETELTDADSRGRNHKKGKFSIVSPTTITTTSSSAGLEEEELTEEGDDGNKKVAPIKISSRSAGSASVSVSNKSSSSVLAGLPASGYISDHPLLSVTINKSAGEGKGSKKSKSKEGCGSKMATPVKMEKISYITDADHSTSEVTSPKPTSKKKKKKSSRSELNTSLPSLDLLAAGGLGDSPPEPKPKSKSRSKKKSSSKHASSSSELLLPPLMAGDSPDVDVGEDELADSSELVIAEPLPKLSSKKKKKKSSHEGGKLKVKLGREADEDFDDVDSNNTVVSSTSISHPHSVYLAEKKKVKKQKVTGGKIIGRSKERKKGRPMTAYTLWCREYRPWVVAENRDMDFAAISRRLGEVWQSLPDKEKLSWRRQAKRLSAKSFVNAGKSGDNHPKSKLINKQHKTVFSENETSPHVRDLYKVVGIAPIDVAAHLKLLGESLSIIGQRLTEHEGQIAVSGSLSVLLDSTLCALGPLLCLSAEIPEFEGCSHETLGSILDNIAYVMPGL